MLLTVIGFNVAQLLKEPTGTVRKVRLDEQDLELAAELHLISPTSGSLRLMRTTSGLLVTGALTQRAEAECSRCVETFVRTQTIELNDEFLPVVDIHTGVPLPELEDREAFRLTPNHELDLSEAIRQYAILDDPMQPLCDPGCKGLCSECGANLNLGPCGCESTRGRMGTLLAERMRQAGWNREEEWTIGRPTKEKDLAFGAGQAEEPSRTRDAQSGRLSAVPRP